jgi:hypothetical protein
MRFLWHAKKREVKAVRAVRERVKVIDGLNRRQDRSNGELCLRVY